MLTAQSTAAVFSWSLKSLKCRFVKPQPSTGYPGSRLRCGRLQSQKRKENQGKEFKVQCWPGAAFVVKSTWKEKCSGVARNLRSQGSSIKHLA